MVPRTQVSADSGFCDLAHNTAYIGVIYPLDMEISPTGYVVLGFLNWEPRTGYEIKQLVDRSTRFFWAASYGQIYPELRRLEENGLVKGRSEPRGGRRREVYSLTVRGREELGAWLAQPPETLEMRNEALLKLFLAAEEPSEEVIRHLAEMERQAEGVAERLRAIAEETGEAKGEVPLCLRFGIEMNDWIADWCERAADELERPADVAAAAAGRK